MSSKRNVRILIALEAVFLIGIFSAFFVYHHELDEENKRITERMMHREEVEVRWEIPDRIMPMTYVGDNKKLVELKVSSQIYGKLRTEIEVPGFINKDVQTFDIKPGSKIYYLTPDISEEGYGNLIESHKGQLSLRIYLVKDDGEKEIVSDDRELLFLSRGSIIWSEDGMNNSKYVVRLINKDKEEIKELVRKAADHMEEVGGNSRSMVGNLGDEKEMERQLEAIFLAVQKDYEVRYVLAPFSYDDASIQQLKTPEEVLRTKSGSCVELSLLVAAALENIGLNSVLVLSNGHAWVGVEVSPMSDKFIFIETTALDSTPEEAIEIAEKRWEMTKKSPNYRLLRTNELRVDGVLPIKY